MSKITKTILLISCLFLLNACVSPPFHYYAGEPLPLSEVAIVERGVIFVENTDPFSGVFYKGSEYERYDEVHLFSVNGERIPSKKDGYKKLPDNFQTALKPGGYDIQVIYVPGNFAGGGLLFYALDAAVSQRGFWPLHPARNRKIQVNFEAGKTYRLAAITSNDTEGSISSADFAVINVTDNIVLGEDQGRFDPERDRAVYDLSDGSQSGELVITAHQGMANSTFESYLVKIDEREPTPIADTGVSLFKLPIGQHQVRIFPRLDSFEKPVKEGDSNVASVEITSNSQTEIYYQSTIGNGRGTIYFRPIKEHYAYERAKKYLSKLDVALSEKKSSSARQDRDYSLKEKTVGEIPFSPLGNKQYWLKTKVSEKMRKIQIGRSSFSIEIPSYEEGKTYVFLLDARNRTKFILSYFDYEYLAELGYDLNSQ
ncbi:MAG: hypothetical protein K6L75_15670 [Cellvibrionaceae bacterium]